MERRSFLKLVGVAITLPLALIENSATELVLPYTCQHTSPIYARDIVIDRDNDLLWVSNGKEWLPISYEEYHDKYPDTGETPQQRKARIDNFLEEVDFSKVITI